MPPTILRPDPAQMRLQLGAFALASLYGLYMAWTTPHGEGELILRVLIAGVSVAGLCLVAIYAYRAATGGMRIELHDDALIYFNPEARRIPRSQILEAELAEDIDSDGVQYLTAIRHRNDAPGEWSPKEKTVLPFGCTWDHAAVVSAINRWLKTPVLPREASASGADRHQGSLAARQAQPAAPAASGPTGGRRSFGLRGQNT